MMAKRGHRTTLDRILLAVTALFVMGGFMALGFLKNTSQENRALLVMISSLGMFGGLAVLTLLNLFWRRLRLWTWHRAMAGWQRSFQSGSTPTFVLPETTMEQDLRELAIRTYARIGYSQIDRGGEDLFLHFVNPEGQIEVFACKQQSEPVALFQVYPLELEIKRVKAVRGFFWGPSGFTEECGDWLGHRPIVLADQVEIGRLVDCARIKGSRLLE